MMVSSRNGRRGTATVFALAAMTFVLAMVTATVLLRSLESYKASADLESRLQARAAAEGAVVALLAAGGQLPQEKLEIGAARVRFALADDKTTTASIGFTVDVFRSAPRPVLSLVYRAHLSTAPPGKVHLERLEVVR